MNVDPTISLHSAEEASSSGSKKVDLILKKRDVIQAASEYELAKSKYCIAIATYILKHPCASNDDRQAAVAAGVDLPKLLEIQSHLPGLKEGVSAM